MRMKARAVEGPDLIGLLARSVPTRLIDISRTGCLLESQQRVDEGTVGELKLDVERETFVDDVRVIRCVLVEGSGSVYLVGAEFLQTHRPGERSIRLAVGSILRELVTRQTARRVRKTSASQSGDGKGTAAPAIVNEVPFNERGSAMKERLVRFIREDEGQDLIEYALLGGLIIAVGAALITSIGTGVKSQLVTLCGVIPGCP